jgi:hypothetical protein
VRIGVEATGNDRWFRKLMSELGHELLVGDASAIHASAPREQRTDKRDARHILRLLVECYKMSGRRSLNVVQLLSGFNNAIQFVAII